MAHDMAVRLEMLCRAQATWERSDDFVNIFSFSIFCFYTYLSFVLHITCPKPRSYQLFIDLKKKKKMHRSHVLGAPRLSPKAPVEQRPPLGS